MRLFGKKIAILGTGAWGTALAMCAVHSGHKVTMWSTFPQEIDYICENGENKVLPGVKVPEEIKFSKDLNFVEDADICIIAVPSFVVTDLASKIAKYVLKDCIVVNIAKGFEPKNFDRLSVGIRRYIPYNKLVVLSGPSHAEEVARAVPSALVAASYDIKAAREIQDCLSSEILRIYTSSDVAGVELGGAVKNIIALAVGICDGMQTGDNTKAALMTRGLKEIAELGIAMGAKKETFAGLTGLGDLIVTCTSMHSRNRRAGIKIGQGVPVEEAIKQSGTVEGYYATKIAHDLSKKYDIEMPITDACYRVCYKGLKPEAGLKELMFRPKKKEIEDTWI